MLLLQALSAMPSGLTGVGMHLVLPSMEGSSGSGGGNGLVHTAGTSFSDRV